MKQVIQRFVLSLALVTMGACNLSKPPDSAFMNRGTPESLLDVSSEVVNLSIASKKDVAALSQWIAKDMPTRAQLSCDAHAPNCHDAKRILESHDVMVMMTPNSANTVTLTYERILAHDCSSRYIDPWDGMYNATPPSFGCAVAANMVQHVSDKREFINPNLSDDPSAVPAVNAVHAAFAPKQVEQQRYSVSTGIINSGGTGGGGQ